MRSRRSNCGKAIQWLAAGVLAGAVTTVAVAWALAAWLPLTGGHYERQWDSNQREVALAVVARPGVERRRWYEPRRHEWPRADSLEAIDPRQDAPMCGELNLRWGNLPQAPMRFAGDRIDQSKSGPRHGFEDARGWPSLALWCEFNTDRQSGTWVPQGGIPLQPRVASNVAASIRALPYRPIWPGFLLNTGLYATAWMMLFGGIFGTRMLLRLRRNRCPACGYFLAGQVIPGCPECGWKRPVIE